METVASETGAIILLLLMGLALLSTIIGVPGTLVIFLLALIYGWLTQFATLSGRTLLILLAMAVPAELADQLMGIWAARRYGATARGIVGSLIGGIVGGILLNGLIPIVGGVVGAFAGAFVGALLVERHVQGDWEAARRAAWGNFIGRAAGIMLKLVVGVIMMVVVARAIYR
jgi:uncharacterized protein YqgC (DUF456 family)